MFYCSNLFFKTVYCRRVNIIKVKITPENQNLPPCTLMVPDSTYLGSPVTLTSLHTHIKMALCDKALVKCNWKNESLPVVIS
jgi:hypothetical protein